MTSKSWCKPSSVKILLILNFLWNYDFSKLIGSIFHLIKLHFLQILDILFFHKMFFLLLFFSYQFKMRRKSWSKHSTIISFLISFLGAYEFSELSGFHLLLFLKWLASFPMRNILLFLACEKALLFLFSVFT